LQGKSPPDTEFFPARDRFALPPPWDKVMALRGKFNGRVIQRGPDGRFSGVTAGVYEMVATP
jgi:hypothetical protein